MSIVPGPPIKDAALTQAEEERRHAEENLLQVIRQCYIPPVKNLTSQVRYLHAKHSSNAPKESPSKGYNTVYKYRNQDVSIERQQFRQRDFSPLVVTVVSTDHTFQDTENKEYYEDIYDRTGDRVAVLMDGDNLTLTHLYSGQARSSFGRPIDGTEVGKRVIPFLPLSGTDAQSLQQQTASLKRITEVLQNPNIQGRLETSSTPLDI